ncbi:Lrp/AsnC family transcriptional regulator [Amycolatopsis jejuensis]|uniref:Lrp/AsnC family transcriptional regulator n=1 Tax=Amycolatopsis jejuensis TaxID=330084 RepID=UPI00069182D1|nr:Lrp/AsnC family transcriptional regulator [Amycolatopsis jejuensis]
MDEDREQTGARVVRTRTVWAAEPAHLSFEHLDDTDRAIIQLLREDGRMSNAQIARELGTSQPTIRNRIARMTKGGLMKVAAVLNPSAHGYACDVVFGIRCKPGTAEAIAERISSRQYTLYVGYTSGVYDLLVDVLFHSDRDLYGFLQSELYPQPGVESVDVLHVIKAGRVDFDWTVPMEMGDESSPGPGRPGP